MVNAPKGKWSPPSGKFFHWNGEGEKSIWPTKYFALATPLSEDKYTMYKYVNNINRMISDGYKAT